MELDMLRKIALWIDDRVHLSKLYASTAGHSVPRNAESWFYVFGSGTLLCFILQVVTGTCLAFVYTPSANEAYSSLEYLNYQQQLGWLLRAMHNWGSNFMLAIMILHLAQVFLFGAFKYPREMTWISGWCSPKASTSTRCRAKLWSKRLMKKSMKTYWRRTAYPSSRRRSAKT